MQAANFLVEYLPFSPSLREFIFEPEFPVYLYLLSREYVPGDATPHEALLLKYHDAGKIISIVTQTEVAEALNKNVRTIKRAYAKLQERKLIKILGHGLVQIGAHKSGEGLYSIGYGWEQFKIEFEYNRLHHKQGKEQLSYNEILEGKDLKQVVSEAPAVVEKGTVAQKMPHLRKPRYNPQIPENPEEKADVSLWTPKDAFDYYAHKYFKLFGLNYVPSSYHKELKLLDSILKVAGPLQVKAALDYYLGNYKKIHKSAKGFDARQRPTLYGFNFFKSTIFANLQVEKRDSSSKRISYDAFLKENESLFEKEVPLV